MATTKIGAMRIDIGADTAQFDKAVSDTQRKLAGIGKRFEAVGGKLTSLGSKMSIGLTAPFAALAVTSVKAANESAAALAQVESALKSMGNASGRTSEQLSDLAGRLQDTSLFDDDDIMAKSTANLLTFGNVAKETFDRAQQAIVDYAARTGSDLQPATIMIGKALNSPLKGLTALSKVGVQFTSGQKAMIEGMVKSGNIAGAQGIILTELERQYKGAAQAARDASPTAATEQAWRTFQETVGALAAKVLPPLTAALTGVLDAFNKLSPETQKYIVIGAGVVAALGPVITVVGGLVTGVGVLIPVLTGAAGVFATLATVINTTVLPAIGSAIVALSPILVPLAAVAVGVGAVYLAWKNWDKITSIVSGLYSGVKTWLLDKLGGVFDRLKGKITAVGDWFYKLYDRVVGHSYIPDMVDLIGKHMARLDDNMVKPAGKAAQRTAEAFKKLASDVAPILNRLFPEQARANQFETELATLEKNMRKVGFTAAEVTAAVARLRAEFERDTSKTAPLMDRLFAERVSEREYQKNRSALLEDKSLSEDDRKKALVRLNNEKGDWLQGIQGGDIITKGIDFGSGVEKSKGALAEYLETANRTADQINQAFERVTVDGLESLTDGVTDAIMGCKNLGDVFKNVANQIISDLVRIAVQKAITGALESALGGLTGGGNGILGSIGKVLGIGGKAGGAVKAIASSARNVAGGIRVPGMRNGGEFATGGSNVLVLA